MPPTSALFLGLAIFLILNALNRWLGEKNFATLTTEEKVLVIDSFRKHRSWATYLPIACALALIAIIWLLPQSAAITLPIGFAFLFSAVLAIQIAIWRTLEELELSDKFVARFRFQSAIITAGNALALSLLAYAVVVQIT